MGESDLTGERVKDGDGRVYEVARHHLEADELLLKRGEQTHAITMMDIADGPFEFVEETGWYCPKCEKVIDEGHLGVNNEDNYICLDHPYTEAVPASV